MDLVRDGVLVDLARALDLANLKPAHKGCNSSRGAAEGNRRRPPNPNWPPKRAPRGFVIARPARPVKPPTMARGVRW